MSKPAWFKGALAAVVAAALVAAGAVAFLLLRGDLLHGGGPGPEFVTRQGDHLVREGKPFATAGANNYRLMFLENGLVDLVMQTAAKNNLGMMRAWAFNDIGLSDGTGSLDFANRTTYFHYWDGKAPAFNDGENGLQKLDYVVAAAKANNIRLVFPFVNNWNSFGGMDQYVQWAGKSTHADFYTDATIRGWYKDWVSHLLNRTNMYTKVKYKDEPTIAVWELANEARCKATHFPQGDCTADTVTAWVKEMSAHVKSIDHKHLLGFGDEGFLCEQNEDHFAYNCSQGVDGRAIAALDDIDLVGLHLYPDHWNTDVAWATDYIKRHTAIAAQVGKPVFIGEYGWRRPETRSPVFQQWLDTFARNGGDIALYWVMEPKAPGILPADSDGFTAYCPSPVCTMVGFRAQAMATGRTDFAPVADDDFLLVAPGQPGTLDPLANDVSLFSTVDPASLDLDPVADGVQATLSVPGGVLVASAGRITYTPAPGFTGRVDFAYTVADAEHRVSAPAEGTIRVSS